MIRVGLSRRTIFNRMVRQDFAYISALSPAAWYRYNTGITVTGAGVSTWADQSGNGRNLLQGTDANRPALQGDGSILFDGAAFFLKANAFTLNQPTTIYLLLKQVTWTDLDTFCDGDANNSGKFQQAGITPQVRVLAPTIGIAVDSNLIVGAYGVASIVFNSTSSVLQINNNAANTGDAGTNNMGGFTLGANGLAGAFSNIQVKEVILFATAHDATTRGMVIRYLARVGGLSI